VPLDAIHYRTVSDFDALNRVIAIKAADGTISKRTYDLAGNLKTIQLTPPDELSSLISYIADITYSADGKITSIKYGNGSCTKHTFDPATRYLKTSETRRIRGGVVLQDISYTYDCMGRLTHTSDRARQKIYFRNACIPAEQDFAYDPLGQLVISKGREQVDVTNGGGRGLTPYCASGRKQGPIPGDGSQLCRYTETYEYDNEGNTQAINHAGSGGASGWSRKYYYEEASCLDLADETKNNRLSRTTLRSLTEHYGYDDDAGKHGCMTSMPGYSSLIWDHNDRLRASATQAVKEGIPEITWYVYDYSGAECARLPSPPRVDLMGGRRKRCVICHSATPTANTRAMALLSGKEDGSCRRSIDIAYAASPRGI
jgi:YD repeat-containing protein